MRESMLTGGASGAGGGSAGGGGILAGFHVVEQAARFHCRAPDRMKLLVPVVELRHPQQEIVGCFRQVRGCVGGNVSRAAQGSRYGRRKGNGLVSRFRQQRHQPVQPAIPDLVGAGAAGLQDILAVEV